MKPTREPKNAAEHAVWKRLQSEGWKVIRSGWPDFFCFRIVDDKEQIMVIEVKRKHWHALRPEQRLVMAWLQSLGAKVMRGDGTGGLVTFDNAKEDLKIEEPEFQKPTARHVKYILKDIKAAVAAQ